MKHILLAISIIYSINCLSQEPSPDLFQTWYLYTIDAGDAGPIPEYVISEIEPSITPTLTFMEDLTFNGVAACNTFTGNLNLLNSSQLSTEQYSFTTDDCGVQIHNNFENEYSEFILTMLTYSINSVSGGLQLNIETSIFGSATFRNFPLNVKGHELPKIEIYPNPTNSKIHFNAETSFIFNIEIYNSLGQSLKKINNDFGTLNISNLPNGIYFIKIDTELGPVSKKIIKE